MIFIARLIIGTEPIRNGLHSSYTLLSIMVATVISGPIPAGSPMVIATTGFFSADIMRLSFFQLIVHMFTIKSYAQNIT
ncbi:Uncharacterised protein [Klebsiella pneumoniae]|uniref:Uncharacterized protein n=1 Tax=Klebsiella pneumoniae TaxID=573 RepID=A0A2X3F9R4_KLEPN|nr:Uncharacterised protein [Klebsiella pneumoniae]